MPIIIERSDYEFLLMAEKFCRKIDSYTGIFDLDMYELENLKDESRFFSNIFLVQSSSAPVQPDSFTRSKIQNMRINLSHLAQNVKNNPNYTVAIGTDLGIEIPVYAFLPN